MPAASGPLIEPYLGYRNFMGSSGYGTNPVTGRYDILRPDPSQPDYPIWSPRTGQLVSARSGLTWTGGRGALSYPELMRQESASRYDRATQPGAQAIDPNDPSQRYRAVDVLKSPAIAGETSNLLETFRKNADNALKGFNEHLSNFNADINTARTASLTAQNIEPTVAALTGAQNRYSTALDAAAGGYRGALDRGAATERGLVGQAYNWLPEYDAAGQAIADRQMQEAERQVSRYKLAGGTPMSLGSDETAMLARAAQDVMLPLKQAQIAQRYNILQGMQLPVEQGITNRDITYYGQFQPSISGSRYQSAQQTALAIQNLRQQVTGMSYDNAMRYMQSIGVPVQLQQQILSGQIGQLGGLAQLEEASRYRGLQDRLGVNVSQPQYFNMGVPGYPGFGGGNRYGPSFTGPTLTGSTPSGTGIYDDTTGGYRYQPIAGAPGGPSLNVPSTVSYISPRYNDLPGVEVPGSTNTLAGATNPPVQVYPTSPMPADYPGTEGSGNSLWNYWNALRLGYAANPST